MEVGRPHDPGLDGDSALEDEIAIGDSPEVGATEVDDEIEPTDSGEVKPRAQGHVWGERGLAVFIPFDGLDAVLVEGLRGINSLSLTP